MVYEIEVIYKHLIAVEADSEDKAIEEACGLAWQLDADETKTTVLRTYDADAIPSYKVGDHFIGRGGELVVSNLTEKKVFYYEVGDTSLEGSIMNRCDFEESIRNGTLHSQREETEMEKAIRLIDSFCVSEYQAHANLSKLDRIPIGHTTITDDELPIQVYVDLVNFKIERYILNVPVETCEYDSLEMLILFQLDGLEFSDISWFTDEQVAYAVAHECEYPPSL